MSRPRYRAFTPDLMWLSPAGNRTSNLDHAAGWNTLKEARRHVRAFRPGLYTIYNLRTIKSVERIDTRSKQ